jgi:hypothetical protein
MCRFAQRAARATLLVVKGAPLNEYDLGLPSPIASSDERRRALPSTVRVAITRFKGLLCQLDPARVTLFGSYARNQFDEDSDIDVLVLVDHLDESARGRIVDAAVECSRDGLVLSPLIMTVAQYDGLRSRELLIAEDIEREGLAV